MAEPSIMNHVGIVLLLLWLLSYFNCCHPFAYFISLIYLYLAQERYILRLRKKVQFEGAREANKHRVSSGSETVQWLNHVVERIWPVCMEQIVSQKILLPIIPWFLQKYKPWTAKEAVLQHLYLGKSPPMFTEIRVRRQSTNDDHLALELAMNFRTADDMCAILAAKLRKRLGSAMWAKLQLTGMHIEGKVLIGVKFIHWWPFLGRLRVCFVEPPYVQMDVKPIFTHGPNVTELPVTGWWDVFLGRAIEEALVEPNMLFVDVEKFASPQRENWFFVDVEDEPIAYARVEVVQATDLKPSGLNGFADPFVTGQLGPYTFKTKQQRKTLAPKWNEEFKIPIHTQASPNVLSLVVCDESNYVYDTLGDCSINISDLWSGKRHDMWLPLQNIEIGRLHLAVTVLEDYRVADDSCGETLDNEYESFEGNKGHPMNSDRRGPQKISSEFHRNPRKEDISGSILEPAQSPHANLRSVKANETGVTLIVEDNLYTPSVIVPKAEGVANPEGSVRGSPSEGHVSDISKSILKHAAKSACDIKNAFVQKGSRKSQDDLGLLVTERGVSVGFDCLDEECLPSSIYVARLDVLPVVSTHVASGNDSLKTEEHVQMSPSEPAVNVEDPLKKVSLEVLERIENTPNSFDENGERLFQPSSNTKIAEENL